MVCDSQQSAHFGVILQSCNIRFLRGKMNLWMLQRKHWGFFFLTVQTLSDNLSFIGDQPPSVCSLPLDCLFHSKNLFFSNALSSSSPSPVHVSPFRGLVRMTLTCSQSYEGCRVLFLQFLNFVSYCNFFVCQGPKQQSKLLIRRHWGPRCTPDSGLY